MYRAWKFLDGLSVCFDTPDDGGAGGDGGEHSTGGGAGDHPEFEVPDGVGGAGDGEHDGGNPPAKAGAPDPSAAGGAPGGRGPGGQPVETVPKYRLDETIAARDRFERESRETKAEVEKLRRYVATALGIADPNAPAPAKELTPREKAIQQRIFELIPELKDLKDLAQHAGSLKGLVEQMPAFERQTGQYWNRVAATMLEGMEDGIAALVLGDGKKGADLDPKMKARYRADFASWVGADPKRVERYEAIDRTLIDEYKAEVDEAVVQPLRRQYGAKAATRARQIGKLPVAGNSSAPVAGVKKPAVPVGDADAAADAAWANLQERVAAE